SGDHVPFNTAAIGLAVPSRAPHPRPRTAPGCRPYRVSSRPPRRTGHGLSCWRNHGSSPAVKGVHFVLRSRGAPTSRGDDGMRKLRALVLMACIVVSAGAVVAAEKDKDPLSGTWVGDWGPSASDRNQVTVELKWDGKTLTGNVNPGPNAVPLDKASFDPKAN